MFQAIFVGNERIDTQTCAAIASSIKLDARLFGEAVGSSPVNERVTASARRAFERGAFGRRPKIFTGGDIDISQESDQYWPNVLRAFNPPFRC